MSFLITVFYVEHCFYCVKYRYIVPPRHVNLLNFLVYFFIFECTGSSLLCPHLFPSCSVYGLLSSYSVRAPRCGGFSCYGGFSGCGARALGYGLSSLTGMWNLPAPGIELVSSALAGRFLTTEPSGRSPVNLHKIVSFEP